jgi:hypothetical protein
MHPGSSGAAYVVCGWYTPDYRHWWDALRPSLDRHGAAHDFLEVPKVSTQWEANTMRKPHEVAKALAWHPDNVVIFIDVDSVVHGPLDALPSIRGDVALYVRTKYRRNGGMRFGTRSGTLVVRPTDMARAFVANWVAAASEAPWGDVDQTPLAIAIGRTPGVCIEPLDVRYCATEGDKVSDPIILHDSASRSVRKLRPMTRLLGRLLAPTIRSHGSAISTDDSTRMASPSSS